jgi:disulfide bond formation protein DsbB
MPLSTPTDERQLDKLFGLAMLIIASTVFLYYTVWTLLMVSGSRLR